MKDFNYFAENFFGRLPKLLSTCPEEQFEEKKFFEKLMFFSSSSDIV